MDKTLHTLSMSVDHLKGALLAEGVKADEEALVRVFRRLANPAGCEKCGQSTRVARVDDKGLLHLLCCGSKEEK